jgi:hypothetical protein
MSTFITSTQIRLMNNVMDLVRSYNLEAVGIYPTDTTSKYIVSTCGVEAFQTANIYDGTLTTTTEADFDAFVVGQL